MRGTYEPVLVTLSILLAMLASYAALDLASRVTAAHGRGRAAWFLGGSVAMGIGIWSMHFVAMLALRLPVAMMYDVPFVVLSVLVAIGASLVALVVVGRESPRVSDLALAAPLMGSAIAGMHYIGMAAVRVPSVHRYDSLLVVLSVAIAIGASFAALWLAFRSRADHARGAWMRKTASAAVMGLAIAGMHYTAMAAATFGPADARSHHALGHLVATPALTVSVIVTAFVILGMAVFSATIDRWSRMHAAVRESEERFRLLVENVEDYAIYTLDPSGNVTSWNHGAERLEQYQRAEIVGRHFSCFFPPEAAGTPEIAIRTAAADGRFEDEGWRVRKDGSQYWASAVINALRDAQGRLVGFVRITRDMTTRRQTEEALEQSEASLRSFVDSAPFGIYRSTPEGRFLAVNPALVHMLGYESESQLLTVDIGRDVYLEADERRRLSEQYRGLDRMDVHVRWKRTDGTPITVRITGRPVRGPDGDLRYWEAFVEDVTPLRVAEQALRDSEARLRQAQKLEAVGTLAGGVAHDFNNLLTVIRAHAAFALEDHATGQVSRDDLKTVEDAADRAASLTRQLLAFSRRQVLQPQVLDLNGLVSNFEKMIRRVIPADISLVTALASEIGLVEADPGQLEQVLMNLVVNARDAMPDGGTLTIGTANEDVAGQAHGTGTTSAAVEPGCYVTFLVSDTGIGMDQATQARIFEPFFTTKERGAGTGLGLSTAYGIVKQSGGYICVFSEPGKGTTFRVYLPRAAAGETRESERRPAHPVARRCTETVLLVEDDRLVRTIARRVLVKSGYRVLEAQNGAEALRVCSETKEPINLILSDLVMPEMGGRDLVYQLRESQPGARVLFMSGYTEDAALQQNILQVGEAFLAKPFTPDTLTRKVREVLETPGVTAPDGAYRSPTPANASKRIRRTGRGES
jgi:PAS domain S-box-containing protein